MRPILGSYIDLAVKVSREPGSVIRIALAGGRALHPAIWIVKETAREWDVIESRGSGALSLANPPR